jgi:hypothetical protein
MERLDDDVKTVIREYIPNMCVKNRVVPKVLRELEGQSRIRNTGFVCEMEKTKRVFLRFGECLRIEYPYVKNGWGTVFYVELHIFRSVVSRSFFMEYCLYDERLRGHNEIRKERFSFKSKTNKRKYYVLFQKFTV